MAGLGHSNDLTTTTFAVLGSLDDTRQIQDLDLGSIVDNLTRYCSELHLVSLVCGRSGRALTVVNSYAAASEC